MSYHIMLVEHTLLKNFIKVLLVCITTLYYYFVLYFSNLLTILLYSVVCCYSYYVCLEEYGRLPCYETPHTAVETGFTAFICVEMVEGRLFCLRKEN